MTGRSAIGTAILLAVVSSTASAATYRCREINVSEGATPRALMLQLDTSTESAAIATASGPAEGMVQTTLDAYFGRLQAANGAIYLLVLHRHTGRMTLSAETPGDRDQAKPGFVGTCVAD